MLPCYPPGYLLSYPQGAPRLPQCYPWATLQAILQTTLQATPGYPWFPLDFPQLGLSYGHPLGLSPGYPLGKPLQPPFGFDSITSWMGDRALTS